MSELVQYRKFALGYEQQGHGRFVAMIKPYLPTISEVYFSWPGMISGRSKPYGDDIEQSKQQLFSDLHWCRQHGIKLDLLFNGNCYGEEAFSASLKQKCYAVIDELDVNGLFPEIVTTTSQYIAKVIKLKYPQIDIRASVNMRMESTKACEFVSDIFDSCYICRDIQRDRKILKEFSDWCHGHGKKLCMLANSGCLRCCPVQTFHDNYISHYNENAASEENLLNFPMRLCGRHLIKKENKVDFLRMSWIRPEDLHYYEPFVDVIKIATRVSRFPFTMVKAYAEGHHEGNLLDILGTGDISDYIDNTAFPEDWVESGIAQSCALNCSECGRCDEVLKKVYRTVKRSYSVSEHVIAAAYPDNELNCGGFTLTI